MVVYGLVCFGWFGLIIRVVGHYDEFEWEWLMKWSVSVDLI